MENCPLIVGSAIKIVIFHSCVSLKGSIRKKSEEFALQMFAVYLKVVSQVAMNSPLKEP